MAIQLSHEQSPRLHMTKSGTEPHISPLGIRLNSPPLRATFISDED